MGGVFFFDAIFARLSGTFYFGRSKTTCLFCSQLRRRRCGNEGGPCLFAQNCLNAINVRRRRQEGPDERGSVTVERPFILIRARFSAVRRPRVTLNSRLRRCRATSPDGVKKKPSPRRFRASVKGGFRRARFGPFRPPFSRLEHVASQSRRDRRFGSREIGLHARLNYVRTERVRTR